MMFVTAGPVSAETFVGRDHELQRVGDQWLSSPLRHYGAIIGPRQIGKTSLLYRIADEFAGCAVFALVNTQLLSKLPPDRQFRELSCQIVEKLSLEPDKYGAASITSGYGFLGLLRGLGHRFSTGQVVIMLDRAGCIHEQVAATIRAAFTEGTWRDARLARLFFILADAQDFLSLITETSSLRSVVDVMFLGELSFKETRQVLSIGFSEDVDFHDAVASIFDWSFGHPYLVQAIGRGLAAQGQPVITKDMVDLTVESLMEGDLHLMRVASCLSQLQPASQTMIRDIASQPGTVHFTRLRPAIAELEQFGLIRNEGEFCVIRNKIYSKLIDQYLQHPLSPTDQPQLQAVHDLLAAAFSAKDLRRFIFYTENKALQPLLDRFGPEDNIDAMLDEVIDFCLRNDLLRDLLREVEQKNPRQFNRFRDRLHAL